MLAIDDTLCPLWSQTSSIQRELNSCDYVQHWAALHAQVARAAPQLACYAVDDVGSLAQVESSPALQEALDAAEDDVDEDRVLCMLPVDHRLHGWLHFVAQSVE